MKIISGEIKKMYSIEEGEKSLYINKPAFVYINKDDEFEIRETDTCVDITNSRCAVTLWKDMVNLHITIFK